MPRERILLINPPLYRHPIWDPIRVSQPLGLWSIGSLLLKRGHEVKVLCAEMLGFDTKTLLDDDGNVLSASVESFQEEKNRNFRHLQPRDFLALYSNGKPTAVRIGMSPEEMLTVTESFAPTIVGIASSFTCNHRAVIDLVQLLRSSLERSVAIVVGGAHATALPETLLRDSQGQIDAVVRGEAEETMARIAKDLRRKNGLAKIPGLSYLDSGVVKHNPRPRGPSGRHFRDINAFFDLEPSLMEGQGYSLPMHTYTTQGRKFTDILFSLGCHRKCSFCYSTRMHGPLRWLSVKKMRDLLGRLHDYGYEELVLQDDDLLYSPRFFDLLESLNDFGFYWQSNGGIAFENVSREKVEAIMKSKCTSLYIPFNPRSLKDRVPSEPEKSTLELIREMRRSGIYTFTSGIYGVPDLECPRHFIEDMDRLCDSHVDFVQAGYFDAALVFPLAVLPGTPWWKKLAEEDSNSFSFEKENWLQYSIFVPQVHPRDLSAEDFQCKILEIHQRINHVQRSYPWFSPFPNTPIERDVDGKTEVKH